MVTLRIRVTAEHIDQGIPRDTFTSPMLHPITLAVNEHLRPHHWADIDGRHVRIRRGSAWLPEKAKLPSSTAELLIAASLKRWWEANPLEFDLELPESALKFLRTQELVA